MTKIDEAKETLMNMIQNVIDTKFSDMIKENEKIEAKFTTVNIVDSQDSIIYDDNLEVGTAVTISTPQEEGDDVIVAATEGEYITADNIIVVDADGNLKEVKEVEVEETKVNVKVEETKTETKTEVKQEEETKTEVKEEETKEEETKDGLPAEVITWLNSITGNFENGDIYLSFYKDGGKLTYGNVSTWAEIGLSKDTLDSVKNLEKKVETLLSSTPENKINLKETKENVKLSRTEILANVIANKRNNNN